MKTVTKIIIIAALVLFAAIKIFAGGAASGGFAKKSAPAQPRNFKDSASWHKLAAETQEALMEAAGRPLHYADFIALLDAVEKKQLYLCDEFNPNAIMKTIIEGDQSYYLWSKLVALDIYLIEKDYAEALELALSYEDSEDRSFSLGTECIEYLVQKLKPKRDAVAQQLRIDSTLPTVLIELIADYSL